MKDPLQALSDLRLRVDQMISVRREVKRIYRAQEKWGEVMRVETEATTLLHVLDEIDRTAREITGAGDAASCFYSYSDSVPNTGEPWKPVHLRLGESLEARFTGMAQSLKNLTHAVSDVQDWSGPRVGECLEQAEKHLSP